MSIKFESADGIARVTLAAPERRNSLTPGEFAELRDILATIARTPSDRAVVLTGEGTAFCAGAFLPLEGPDVPSITLMRQINETARALYRLPQPVVAAVNGHAVGAGMSMALGCDFVIASSTATFSQVFVKRGLSPDFGSSWQLPRVVGLANAKKLALLGDTIGAQEAERLGIVTEVVAPEELAEAATRLARRAGTAGDGPLPRADVIKQPRARLPAAGRGLSQHRLAGQAGYLGPEARELVGDTGVIEQALGGALLH